MALKIGDQEVEVRHTGKVCTKSRQKQDLSAENQGREGSKTTKINLRNCRSCKKFIESNR